MAGGGFASLSASPDLTEFPEGLDCENCLFLEGCSCCSGCTTHGRPVDVIVTIQPSAQSAQARAARTAQQPALSAAPLCTASELPPRHALASSGKLSWLQTGAQPVGHAAAPVEPTVRRSSRRHASASATCNDALTCAATPVGGGPHGRPHAKSYGVPMSEWPPHAHSLPAAPNGNTTCCASLLHESVLQLLGGCCPEDALAVADNAFYDDSFPMNYRLESDTAREDDMMLRLLAPRSASGVRQAL